MSLVYPLARGVAPVLVLVVSVVALGATVSPLQAGGVAFVACGVLLVRGVRTDAAAARGIALALAVAGCIAGYTLAGQARRPPCEPAVVRRARDARAGDRLRDRDRQDPRRSRAPRGVHTVQRDRRRGDVARLCPRAARAAASVRACGRGRARVERRDRDRAGRDRPARAGHARRASPGRPSSSAGSR